MEEIYESGKARAIGVSNWTIPGLKKLLSFAKVKPAVNQIEIHPFLPNEELVRFCLDNDILPAAYSPLGSQDQVPSTGEKVRTDPTLNEVATRSGNTLAQVLLAWEDHERLVEGLAGAVFTPTVLAAVRRRGWAQSLAEREPGVASVSAPVLDRAGGIAAAVSVSGPVERLGRDPGRRFGDAVLTAAARISESLSDERAGRARR